jgi:hypothetical protein
VASLDCRTAGDAALDSRMGRGLRGGGAGGVAK